ncbi:MAG TPA: VapC toxin family PIN domain ribonuclease [Candidatus Paceibacterota bacterium]|nr:VapC toxin family PIN domain ribonuclease [Verrucomicrobiota bacterium]HRY47786.1 VapC toxin family PIN domain ribonuclease [Candidatus Paceibacterota bacterium]HSA00469.1 VapC toxin family PIN domain ribonuclease [Candidatus Paceibacterota bacterium]
MAVLCDVNWLVALCCQAHQHHALACAWLEAGNGDKGLVVCRISQLGMLRLLTTPVLMKDDVCTTNTAWLVYDTMMSDSRFSYREEPLRLGRVLRALTKDYPFSPNLWQDAYLAAFAMTGDFSLITFDKGFRKFADLNCVVLPDDATLKI